MPEKGGGGAVIASNSYFEKVRKNALATIQKGNLGYDQYTVPDTVPVESTFVAFF